MADNLNIKNPSVLPGDLDLRTDSSGNIVSISGHPIAGGGGGGGGMTYYGDNEYIQIKNGTVNTFTVTDKIKEVVDDFAGNVSVLIDAQTYNKSSIDTMLSEKQDELVFSGYDDKIETINGSGFMVNGYVTDFSYQIDKNKLNNKIDDLSASVSSKQDKLTFEYDEDNKVSAINGSALAGQGGTTYTPGQYINIDSNNEISVTGLVAIDEYATYSGDWNDVSNSYKTNSGSFLTSEDLTNYYPKTDTSSKTELQTKFNSLLDYDVVTGNSAVLITTADANNTRTFTISLTATPTAADTVLNGQNGVDATLNGNVWNVGLSQSSYNAVNNVQNKLDTTAAAQTYQPIGNYVSSTDISDMATKTWVGNQGYLTEVPSDYVTDSELQTTLGGYATNTLVQNTSAAITALIPSTAGLASESDLQIVSAGVDYVSANAITAHQSLTNYYEKSETSGASELSTALGNIWSNFDEYALKSEIPTVPTKVSDLTDSANYYKTTETSSKNELSTEFAKYLTTSQYETDSATFVTSSISTITGTKQYALTTAGWAEVQAGTSFTGVTTTGSISGGGVNNDTIGLLTSAENALTAVANKVDKPSSLVDKYLVLRTDNAGNVSGWYDLQDQSYSKSEANGTFVATANIDSTTLSGDGKSVSTKLGVKTDVIATRDYVNSSFLPTSGGTVSGKTTLSGSAFDTLELKRSGQTSTGTIGINGAGGISLKITDSNSNNTQLNIAPNADMDKRFSIGDSPYSPIAYLIPAVTATTSAGLTNDGILHIILESN